MQQQPQEVPVYIVQRCWFDGPQKPNEPVSVDLRRIFTDCQVAEQVAIQSANAYCSSKNNHSNNGNSEAATVSTILLNTHNSATSYAFATSGKLFWVRRCFAAAAAAGASMISPAGAVCSITEGVIGGTGNPRSSRGNEQVRHCVVLVPNDDAQQGQAAAQHLRQVASNNSALHPNTIMEPLRVQVGPLQENEIDTVLQDWPDYETWKPTSEATLSKGKRGDNAASSDHNWGQTQPFIMASVEEGLAPPPAKKRAFRS